MRYALVWLFLALGCGPATEGTTPGQDCELIADCNAGQTCGELVACVRGHCLRDQPTLHKPCAN